MTSSNHDRDAFVARYPQLSDPTFWPELSPEVEMHLAEAIARDAASEGITAHDRVLGRRAATARWSSRVLQIFRVASAACILPPPLFIPSDWPGKHLALYAIAFAYTFLIAVGLLTKRAWGSAIAAAALGLLALVDCVAWLRIYDEVSGHDFPRLLAYMDVVAYFAIVVAAAALIRGTREKLDAPPSRWLYIFFSTYCYGACVFWHLLSTSFRDSGLAVTLRRVWDLDGIAASFEFPDVDGLRFMTWLVWALYGISGSVSLYLMARRHSLRVTVRWLLVPCSLYACMGPWVAESWQWFRYTFLLLILAAIADWLWLGRRRR